MMRVVFECIVECRYNDNYDWLIVVLSVTAARWVEEWRPSRGSRFCGLILLSSLDFSNFEVRRRQHSLEGLK